MSKKFKPFLAHSELTDCIYIIDGNDKYEVTEQCISAMKATNRMPRWIPVSERLPKVHKDVLICLSSDQICIGCYNSHRLPFSNNVIGWGANYTHNWCSNDVIAWMPLPTPPNMSEIPTGQKGARNEYTRMV